MAPILLLKRDTAERSFATLCSTPAPAPIPKQSTVAVLPALQENSYTHPGNARPPGVPSRRTWPFALQSSCDFFLIDNSRQDYLRHLPWQIELFADKRVQLDRVAPKPNGSWTLFAHLRKAAELPDRRLSRRWL